MHLKVTLAAAATVAGAAFWGPAAAHTEPFSQTGSDSLHTHLRLARSLSSQKTPPPSPNPEEADSDACDENEESMDAGKRKQARKENKKKNPFKYFQ